MISPEEVLNSKILIIDDQKLHIRLLEGILQKTGYKNIFSVIDSRQAIEVVKDYSPDIILLDLIMPYVDGFQIMEELTPIRQGSYLPILVLTAEKSAETKIRALESGATDFLNKPYESIEVLMRLRNMIEARILHLQVSNQNKILESQVKDRTKELHDTRLDIIRRLAHAAEWRDNDTGMHIIRMSHYCARLGEALGFNDVQTDLLLNASPLHDIGKIGIPDSILLKPGKLTTEEFEIMKTHTTIGAELLAGANSAIMKMAQTIALTHHERWDGKGYPKGLKGDTIPLVGQICSVCDVFDALTSKRPYKRAWTTEEALSEIEAQKGKQFDARLVEQFVKIIPKIEKIKNEYS